MTGKQITIALPEYENKNNTIRKQNRLPQYNNPFYDYHTHRSNKKDCLSVEGRPPTNITYRQDLCSCDLDLDPVTLIYELDLAILEMDRHTKNELLGQCFR